MNSLPENATQYVESPKKNNQKLIVILGLIVISISIIGITLFVAQRKTEISKPHQQIILEEYNLSKPEVVSQRIEQLAAFTPEEKIILTKAFAERDWPNAKTERQKWSAYRNLYSSLWARYNVTHDAAIKAEMKKIEDFLAITWPDFHPAAVQGGGFLR